MWAVRTDDIPRGRRYRIQASAADLTFREYFSLLQDDSEFAAWYTDILSAASMSAFFWEHPGLTTANYDEPAEFVLIDSPALARFHGDPQVFQQYFEPHPDDGIVSFANLSGDAMLVAPAPAQANATYPHLAEFLRNAPKRQVASLWRHVGQVMDQQTGTTPKWLSTSGLGLPWLHIRVDSQPKYYQHRPYKSHAHS
jgi:hypothetical protein